MKKNEKNSSKANAKKSQSAAPAVNNSINWGETAKIALILFGICAIITGLLAATNMLTADIIAANAKADKENTCKVVIAAEEFIELSDSGYDAYAAVSNGDVIGCAITATSSGYGGELSVMVGFDLEGDITGVVLLSHNETPGLGSNAAKPGFLTQYISVDGEGYPGEFAVTKDGGDIDAVTAATISSRAVTAAVNEACNIYEELAASGALSTSDGGED